MNMLRNRGTALPSHGGGGGLDIGGGGGGGYNNNDGGGYGGYNGGSGGGYGGGNGMNSGNNSNSKSSKDKGRSRGFEPWKNPLVLYGVAAFFICTTLYYRSSGNSLLKALNVKTQDAAIELVQGLERDVSRWKKQGDKDRAVGERKSAAELARLEKTNRQVQKERDDLRTKHEGPDKIKKDVRIQDRDDAFAEQVAVLEKATKRESLRTVLEK